METRLGGECSGEIVLGGECSWRARTKTHILDWCKEDEGEGGREKVPDAERKSVPETDVETRLHPARLMPARKVFRLQVYLTYKIPHPPRTLQ